MGRPRRASALMVLVLCGLLAASPAAASETSKWIEVESAHFTIMSRMSKRATQEIARELELFRATVAVATNAERLKEAVPVRIYAFRRPADFKRYVSGKGVAGFVRSTPRNYLVVISRTPGMDPAWIMQHEYVHFLVRNQNNRSYPMWYDEGFAEFLGATETQRENVWVGQIPQERAAQLNHSAWIHANEILSPARFANWSAERRSMFYAESWLLVHYLFMVRRFDAPGTFQEQMIRYLDSLEAGHTPSAAFELGFGMPISTLDSELRKYARKGRFQRLGLPIEKLPHSTETSVRKLSKAEAGARLSELALSADNTELALAKARAAVEDSPGNASAQAALGNALAATRQWDEALEHLELAAELTPDDPSRRVDLAYLWIARAGETQDFAERHELARSARRQLVKAHELDDARPETYLAYGSTYLLEGENAQKGIEALELAAGMLRGNEDVQQALAGAYQATGRRADARALWVDLLSVSHEPERVNELRARLDATQDPGTAQGE